MPDRDEGTKDSLDRIELELVLETATETIIADKSLSPQQRERLIRKIKDRIELGLWDEDDFNEGDLGVLVRRLDPKWPKDKSGGAAVQLETESSVESDDVYTMSPPPQSGEGSGQSAGVSD